jgi:hypothetical protein
VLDREEDAALAEIEAALRRDDPEFVELLERMDRSEAIVVVPPPEPSPEPVIILEPVVEPSGRARWARKLLGSIALVVAAVALTLVTALLLGPDIGGLVGVVSLSVAGMVVYQWARGCPGFRRRR